MRWMICSIVACLLAISSDVSASHGGIVCISCHRGAAGFNAVTEGCTVCHQGHDRIFSHAMATRNGERQFVQRSYARFDSAFWEKNCDGCHIRQCRDCHGRGGEISKPSVGDCQVCHTGYFTGWDYSGRAPREDHMRYQRGVAVNGETFLKMLPDVHYTRGMTCGACHSMASLAAGRKSSKGCRDCHRPSLRPVEHRIKAHMERMECFACHSAWGAQEYGTFFLRFRDRHMKDDFDLKPGRNEEYLKSAYLKSQDAPPLGINSRGMVSPIRPMFVAYYTDIVSARNSGPENIILAAEWRAWFPHTVQRGTVTCEACHDSPRRFLLEPERDRIYQLKRDDMKRESFWDQDGQRVANGRFMLPGHFARINAKSPAYARGTIEKWKTLINRVETSSSP